MKKEVSEENNSQEQKKSLMSRIISKLIGWTIKIAIGLVILYFVWGYLDKRQEEFIQTSINSAVSKCGNDQACIKNAKENDRKCVKNNYHQEQVSKKVKKSVLEEEGFYACLESFK